ncbi:MAG TPA: type VI secretion system tube protein TssD [Flavobacterium sp.]|jgi:hypothetical protein
MSFLAKLTIDGKAYNILDYTYHPRQPADHSGKPTGKVISGFLSLTLESDRETTFYDWMLSPDMAKEGTITFYKRDAMSKQGEIEFETTYCVGYTERFSGTGNTPMVQHLQLSPGKITYGGVVYEENWNVRKMGTPKPAPVAEKEKQQVAIEDIYISKTDASVLINYRKPTGNIRMIARYDWDDAQEIQDDREKINQLESLSTIVTVDDAQIQQQLQEIHKRTVNTEHQIFIVLDRESATIKAVIGPEGIDGEAEFNSYKLPGGTQPVVEADGSKYALLGQAHTHNLKKSKPKNHNILGGPSTTENAFGTSEKDKKTAISDGIYIYALDSWNHPSKNAEVTINRVGPVGTPKLNIGKTHGKGDGKKTINIGLECLNLRVGR